MNWPSSGPREWPLAAKVMAMLALTLLPLGLVAAMLARQSYHDEYAGERTISFTQALVIGLPLLMWLAAMIIGWILAARLIVRPLTRMRRIVERYTAGDKSVRLTGQRFFSREVGALAAAFDAMADDIETHDAELRTALDEQRRLTREVHHRVKNNLQIVSSLLSIQARDTVIDEVARAYAMVQSRVAALAIVHRWMYESDTPGMNQGVDLKALTADLCAGLEQGLLAGEHIPVSVVCEVDRMYVGQDTAVPLAFLITELVSDAARLSSPEGLDATVVTKVRGNVATLSISTPVFGGDDLFLASNTDPVSRIVQGMSRQLRSPLRHDRELGRYCIDFPVILAA